MSPRQSEHSLSSVSNSIKTTIDMIDITSSDLPSQKSACLVRRANDDLVVRIGCGEALGCFSWIFFGGSH